eukprot:SAG22_NODE_3993_length_1434_cov_1.182022_1_plen_166_part_10
MHQARRELTQTLQRVETLERELESTKRRLRKIESERTREVQAVRDEMSAKIGEAVKFLLREIRGQDGLRKVGFGSEEGLEGPGGVRELRNELEEQRSTMSSMITTEANRAAAYADVTVSKVKGEIEWFQGQVRCARFFVLSARRQPSPLPLSPPLPSPMTPSELVR